MNGRIAVQLAVEGAETINKHRMDQEYTSEKLYLDRRVQLNSVKGRKLEYERKSTYHDVWAKLTVRKEK